MIALTGTVVTTGLVGCLGDEDESNDSGSAESEDANQDAEEEPDNSTNSDESTDKEENKAANWDYVDEADTQVELTYGETAALSNGVEVIAHGVETFDELSGEQPAERDEFALLHLESVNNGDEENRLPAWTDPDVYLLFEDQQIKPTINSAAFQDVEYEQFEGGDVQPGVRREGHVLFEVIADLTEADINFLWQDEIFVTGDLDGNANVLWTAR